MSLVLKRLEGETWRDAALRQAAKYGLEEEVKYAYRKYTGEECDRWFAACYDWDVLVFEEDPGGTNGDTK